MTKLDGLVRKQVHLLPGGCPFGRHYATVLRDARPRVRNTRIELFGVQSMHDLPSAPFIEQSVERRSPAAIAVGAAGNDKVRSKRLIRNFAAELSVVPREGPVKPDAAISEALGHDETGEGHHKSSATSRTPARSGD